MAQISQSRNLSGNRSSTNSHYFDVSKSSQLLSKFDENDPEAFFEMFEKLANQLEWDKKYWTILIQTKLFGKARTVYNNLNEAEAKDYDTVKKVILLSYDQVTETYRQRFRNTHKSQGMTYMEFVDVLERLFDKWIKSAKTSDFASLRQLMILDQFKFRVPTDIRAYLEEKEVTDLIQAAKLADNYSLTHRKSGNVKAFSGSQTSCDSQDSRKFAPKIQNEQFQSGFKHPNSSTVIYCSYCKQKGHHISECYHKDCQKSKYYQPNKNAQNKSQKNPIQIANVDSQKPSTNKQDKTPPQNIQGKEKPSLSVDIESVPRVGDLFDEFTFSGRISTGPNEDFSDVLILRDTGSAQSILVRSALPNIEKAYTGEKVIVKDLSGSGPMPLANVYIDSDLIKGFARVGVIEKPLPVKGISFLLGNDLAGTLIVPCPVVTSEPVVESCDNELYPVCAVTRAQSKAVDPLDCPDNGLAELFSREEVQNYISMPITRDNLIKAQNQDPSLCEALSSAVDNVHLLKGTGYYMENGLLLRQYRPSHISNKDDWAIVRQIVVPADFRESIVELAHGKFAGHLGINKTSDKLLKHFYWPDLRKTVSKFVKSCHICQIGGKPNQVIPKAPLQPIPVTEEPFNKVIIDCVGPLPKTKKGNQYLLTIMCSVTRYPEAIALKSLRSQVIVKALLKVFTQYGVPQIIQSDRGSNFTASLFSDVMKGLGIAQYFSSAYHPESQGALERFHQTFKTMLRMFCLENEKDWDEGIDLLLFSICDAKNASLVFSPLQLLFGREVRGPLKVLKDTWLNTESISSSLCDYFQKFKDKLERIHSFASDNLLESQSKMKETFDLKSVERSFKSGDLVLVYLPNQRESLKAKYSGPYEVKEKVSKVNYLIYTPDRRRKTRLVHINLLKPYRSRLSEGDLRDENSKSCNLSKCAFNVNISNKTDINVSEMFSIDSCENSNYLGNIGQNLVHLLTEQKEDIINLLSSFPAVCADSPGVCNLAEHDMLLVDGSSPIKQAPYRVTPQKRERMRLAVEYLLVQGLAEPSDSPWASPCILVPKSDKSDRLCTDYRRVNRLTVNDAYPLPRLDDLIDTIGSSKFVSKVDLLRGYYQIPLTERAKRISAFVTPDGLYQYKFMPFGMTNAPATFQRMVDKLIQDLPEVRAYLDDLVITTDDWESHIRILRCLFQRLHDAGLVVRLPKCQFGGAKVEYLGHIIGGGETSPRTEKIAAILDFPVPCTRRALRRFMGMAGFYRRFCKNFAIVAAPLTKLCSPAEPFRWRDLEQESFNQIKLLLVSAPVLKSADFKEPFIIQVDACDVGAGGVLLQEDSSTRVLHPICYFSTKFLSHQRNYSTIEKECLALLMALRKFNFFVYDSPHIVTVHCDHNPLTFIHKMCNHNQRLMRWSLELQDYNLNIVHIKGKNNVIADALSRSGE